MKQVPIVQTDYEDKRNVTIDAGQVIEVKIDTTVVYTKTVSVGKKANIVFQLQEVDV